MVAMPTRYPRATVEDIGDEEPHWRGVRYTGTLLFPDSEGLPSLVDTVKQSLSTPNRSKWKVHVEEVIDEDAPGNRPHEGEFLGIYKGGCFCYFPPTFTDCVWDIWSAGDASTDPGAEQPDIDFSEDATLFTRAKDPFKASRVKHVV